MQGGTSRGETHIAHMASTLAHACSSLAAAQSSCKHRTCLVLQHELHLQNALHARQLPLCFLGSWGGKLVQIGLQLLLHDARHLYDTLQVLGLR